MKFRNIAQFLVVGLLTVGLSSAKDSPDQQREKIRKMASATLSGPVQAATGRPGALSRSRRDTRSSTTWARTCCW